MAKSICWMSPRRMRFQMGIGFDEGNVDDRCEVRGEADTVTSRDGLKFSTEGRFDKIVQLDVIWVPGGNPGALAPMMNGKKPIHVNFLKAQSAKAHVIASVCEGALLLAVAGLLDGFHATTHWSFIPCLKKLCGRQQSHHRRGHLLRTRRSIEARRDSHEPPRGGGRAADDSVLSDPPVTSTGQRLSFPLGNRIKPVGLSNASISCRP
jgi:putative intracellular protease/amidase